MPPNSNEINNFCVYCSVPFGTVVYYQGKIKILQRIKEHFTPRYHGGIDSKENITSSCQICNMIKFTKDFATGTEAQNFILDKLLASDWRIIEAPRMPQDGRSEEGTNANAVESTDEPISEPAKPQRHPERTDLTVIGCRGRIRKICPICKDLFTYFKTEYKDVCSKKCFNQLKKGKNEKQN